MIGGHGMKNLIKFTFCPTLLIEFSNKKLNLHFSEDSDLFF